MRDSIGGDRRWRRAGTPEPQAPVPQIHIAYGEYNVEGHEGMNYLVRRVTTGDTAAISVDTDERVSTFMVRVPGESKEFADPANPKINIKLEYRGLDSQYHEAMVLRLASLALDPFDDGPANPMPRYA